MRLAEYRSKAALLADFLPWAALIGEGVILNKDGSFQRTARFRGPDLDSATPAELVATAARLNSALRRLGSGWAVFVEAQRIPARDYPLSEFPDPISALVDAERRAQFEEASSHYESRYFLTLTWVPPADDTSRASGWLFEDAPSKGADPHEHLAAFRSRSDRLLDLFEGFMPEAAWLDDAETLTYLHSTISTRAQAVRVPETPMHLDAYLADEPLVAGLAPKLGSRSSGSRHRPGQVCSTSSMRRRSSIAGRRGRSVSTRPTPPSFSPASAANGSPNANRSPRS